MTALLAPPSRAFTYDIAAVPDDVRARMDGVSWHGNDPRCPRWDALAYLRLAHVTFDGGVAEGELVVAADLAIRAVAVFRRLYRLERERTTPGSGLGLSLVAAIAELHGASVNLADNRPGLRVEVSFPRT